MAPTKVTAKSSRTIRKKRPPPKDLIQMATVGSGVAVRRSTLAGAGQGLFATRGFAKGDAVTGYEGRIISHQAARGLSREDRSHVRAHQLQRTAIDGKITGDPSNVLCGRGGGSMVNHSPVTEANVAFDSVDSDQYKAQLDAWMKTPSAAYPDPGGRTTYLRAMVDIAAGDELFAYYGKTYWK